MKPVRCSWVDMQKHRKSLASGDHGDQERLRSFLGCVDKSAVSQWKAACDLLDVVEEKVELTQLSTLQPTHATAIVRQFRKAHGKGTDQWGDDVKEAVVEWVERVEAEELTVKQLREALVKANAKPALDEGCTVDDLARLQGKAFGTIYADPPWPYDNQATRAATDNHYQTPTLEWIRSLPVKDLAAEQSHLHLWTTNGFLREAFGVLEAWGFEYKSCFVWCKRQMGIGNYWRVSHEFLLLGVRGALTFADKGLMSWECLDRGKHSAKPPEVRAAIEKASPGPYLELFGRKKVDGWTVWGNQINGKEFRQEAFA